MDAERCVHLCWADIEPQIRKQYSTIYVLIFLYEIFFFLHIANPSEGTHISRNFCIVFVVCNDHTALYCGDVVREKEAKGCHVAEGPCFFPFVFSAVGFARVFYDKEIMRFC